MPLTKAQRDKLEKQRALKKKAVVASSALTQPERSSLEKRGEGIADIKPTLPKSVILNGDDKTSMSKSKIIPGETIAERKDRIIRERQEKATADKAERNKDRANQQESELQIEADALEKDIFESKKSDIQAQIEARQEQAAIQQQSMEKSSAASQAALGGAAATDPGTLQAPGNLAVSKGLISGEQTRLREGRIQIEGFKRQTDTLRTQLDQAVRGRDLKARDEILKTIRSTEEAQRKFIDEFEKEEDKKAETTFGILANLDPAQAAALDPAQLAPVYERLGFNPVMAEGIASSFVAQNTKLSEAMEELQKNPESIEAQNKVLALQGKISDIQTSVQTQKQSALQQKVSTLQGLVDNGTLTQDQFNAALESELGIDPVTKSVGGSLFVTDPVTNKTTEIKTSPDGSPLSPGIADVGTGKITQNYGDKSPLSVDNIPLQNGQIGTPGIDIDGVTGDAIQSFVAGTVTQIANNGGYGNQVIITDADGNEHMYSHLRDMDVPVVIGQTIGSGDVLGFMGNSGSVFDINGNKVNQANDKETGSHLDYRVRSKGVVKDSRWANPNDFIGKQALSGADSGILKINIGKTAFGTRISDAEGEKIDKIVEQTLREQPGLTIPELRDSITDRLIGFELTDNKDFGNALKDVMLVNSGEDGLAGEDMKGIARLVNAGKLKQAVTKVENRAMQNAKKLDPEGFIGESTVTTAVERGRTLEDTIAGLPESPIGVVSGTTEKWLRRLKGEAAQDIATQVVSQVAEMRKRLSGTAVTPEESKFLDPLIPELSDTPENFMIKLSQLKKNPLVQLNNVREVVNLGALDESTLLNREERVGLYQPEERNIDELLSFVSETDGEPVQEEDDSELGDIFD